jgi:hypothetical protein
MLIYHYNNCHFDLDIEANIIFLTCTAANNMCFSSSNVHVGETYLTFRPSVCDLNPSDYQI